MACQEVCPENKGRLITRPSGVELTAEETEAVLEAGRWLRKDRPGLADGEKAEKSQALESARAKFERLGMSEDLEVMGRNLEYFLRRR
jgi:hypothetical protein